ncbi:MAG: pantoate--beta-alanine ligase [Chitinophagaceae bacterium]|nr:MAG: pantoate--beta-alanine ligase [Chitinophagaceae bacterium]
MILVKTIHQLQTILQYFRKNNQSIGFVPTMGALHEGHISLVNTSRRQTGITICSIFVNPTQFNSKTDFEKYPITIDDDINLLESAGCDVLFMPAVTEMYPAGEAAVHFELGFIETILEGKFRPGHFQGVCRIVDKLLAAVQPDALFMGQKDYQQCMVISRLLATRHQQVKLQVEETVREPDGLAMSSRNMRLDKSEREKAGHIIKALRTMKANLQPGDLSGLKANGEQYLKENGFEVDYIEIADSSTLEPVNTWNGKQQLVALVAAFVNEVRLIDNLLLTAPTADN